MDHISLMGAEDVRRAASQMSEAAAEMNRAAANFEDSLFRQRQFMDDWLFRLSEVLDKSPRPGAERKEGM